MWCIAPVRFRKECAGRPELKLLIKRRDGWRVERPSRPGALVELSDLHDKNENVLLSYLLSLGLRAC